MCGGRNLLNRPGGIEPTREFQSRGAGMLAKRRRLRFPSEGVVNTSLNTRRAPARRRRLASSTSPRRSGRCAEPGRSRMDGGGRAYLSINRSEPHHSCPRTVLGDASRHQLNRRRCLLHSHDQASRFSEFFFIEPHHERRGAGHRPLLTPKVCNGQGDGRESGSGFIRRSRCKAHQ